MSNRLPSILRRVTEFILGFIGTAVFFLVVGFAIVAVVTVKPEWATAIRHGSLTTKLLFVLPGELLALGAAAYLWRSKRFVALGIIAYIGLEVLTLALEISHP
jgi:hypothetical protein